MAGMRALAVAQTIPRRGDVASNVAEHVRLARVAAEEGARILVFPELSLTGYELDLAPELAFAERDPRLEPLLAQASAGSMTLVVGAPVRVGAGLCIGAFLLSPEDAVELYTKHHLAAFSEDALRHGSVPPPEASVFEPGTRNPLLQHGGHVAAVAVCADTGHSSHPENAARRGADTFRSTGHSLGDHPEPVRNLSAGTDEHDGACRSGQPASDVPGPNLA